MQTFRRNTVCTLKTWTGVSYLPNYVGETEVTRNVFLFKTAQYWVSTVASYFHKFTIIFHALSPRDHKFLYAPQSGVSKRRNLKKIPFLVFLTQRPQDFYSFPFLCRPICLVFPTNFTNKIRTSLRFILPWFLFACTFIRTNRRNLTREYKQRNPFTYKNRKRKRHGEDNSLTGILTWAGTVCAWSQTD
jgi:hypothetical protein